MRGLVGQMALRLVSFCVLLGLYGTKTVAAWFTSEISSIAVLTLAGVGAPGALLSPGRQRQRPRQAAGGGRMGRGAGSAAAGCESAVLVRERCLPACCLRACIGVWKGKAALLL